MIELTIPGRGIIKLKHLVCDVNGTLAIDGKLSEGLTRKLSLLGDRLQVHLITANTHGYQDLIDRQLNLTATRVSAGQEAQQKAEFVNSLDPDQVIAIGQGANDTDMLATAQIGIGILSPEGLATSALLAADIIVPNIQAALDLIEKPLRIVATLRS